MSDIKYSVIMSNVIKSFGLYLKRELHSRCIGSPVTIKRHTHARGVEGHAPPRKF